ncbi:MAG: S8 family serine peptidase, partial [Kordiimonadaceae bacterium]|nr:S8 family serine peptidase [Kordiimonadaceae bacterium]
KGYDYAIANGADVVNESLGSDSVSSFPLQQAMQRAVAADIVIVLPAGNIDVGVDPAGTGDSIQKSAEVAYAAWSNEQIIVAGSVDSNNQLSDFSYKAGANAKNVFLVVGANRIVVPDFNPGSGDSGYAYTTGTSGATAHISGAVALLREAFPGLDAHDTADLLFTTATDLGDPGIDNIYGRGLINLESAFQAKGILSIAGTGSIERISIGSDGNVSSQNMILSGGAFGADISFGSALENVMVLDKYDRSFSVDLSQGIYLPQNSFSLDNFIEGGTQFRQHSVSLNEKASVKMAWRLDDQFSEINKRYFNHQNINNQQVKDLRMSLTYDLGNQRSTKFASGMSMAEMLDDYRPDDYMAPNKHGFSSLIPANQNKAISFRTPYGKKSTYEVAFSSSNVKYDPLLFSQNITVKSALVLNRFRHNLTDSLSLTFDLGMLQEKGSVLGSVSRGALEIGTGARTTFTGAKLNFWLSDNIEFYANATYGMTKVSASASSILGNISSLKSYSYLAGIKSSSLFTKNDQLSFTVSQPLRLSGGTATVGSVISRNYQSNQFTMAYNTFALSPRATERDFELSYSISNIFGASMRLNLLHQLNPGHTNLIPDTTSVLFRIGSAF